ncbi:MAG TPA: tetratricopeptide repeat protein [Terriglobia bacterium]|nr:tetratricopeptide repeat protein [Terriglobia bacterium]
MPRKTVLSAVIVTILSWAPHTPGQSPQAQQQADAERAFDHGADLMDQGKYEEALKEFRKVIALDPDAPDPLYNAGLAAFLIKDYTAALELWQKAKAIDPTDGMLRSKLIQTYQALGKLKERDLERAELFELRNSGRDPDLKDRMEYCREQFEVNGRKVMAFELFELKGERALRYVFSVLDEKGNREEFRISLGSYELTNAVWRQQAEPKPKPDERLFHLDGYYDWGHATYGMYFPEPSYDSVRTLVIRILEGKAEPISSTTIAVPPDTPRP